MYLCSVVHFLTLEQTMAVTDVAVSKDGNYIVEVNPMVVHYIHYIAIAHLVVFFEANIFTSYLTIFSDCRYVVVDGKINLTCHS
jgi:hypothetical protein